MSTVGFQVASAAKSLEGVKTSRDGAAIDPSLAQALKDVHAIVPPLWPLADYVAVNPCVGLIDRPLLGAEVLLSSVRDCSLLMPLEYFRKVYEDGRLSAQDLTAALAQCAAEHPDWYGCFDVADLTERLTHMPLPRGETRDRFRTVAEAVDQRRQSSWSSHIINDITRHCAAHYDEG